jgi:hypothetical protein
VLAQGAPAVPSHTQIHALIDHRVLSRDGLERGADRALSDFLARARRLPAFAATYHVHRASPRAAQSRALVRTLRALHGKLVVLNQGRVACLPTSVASAVRGLVRGRAAGAGVAGDALGAPVGGDALGAPVGGDSRARTDARRARELLAALPDAAAMLGDGSAVRAVALYEPSSITIHRWAGARAATGVEEGFAADVPYRLVLAVGDGPDDRADPAQVRAWLDDPATRRSLVDAPVWTWARAGDPLPWFVADLLLPDDDALRQMTDVAAAAYTHATGRQGGGAIDRYWHLPAWERFEERGRVVGYVTPNDVTGLGARVAGGPPAHAPARRLTHLTPSHDHARLLPPGYCLVRCVGTLELSVLRL